MPHNPRWQRFIQAIDGRFVLTIYLVVMLVISARVWFSPIQKGNVYPVFAYSGRCWLEGLSPYNDPQYLFRYTPLSAAVMTPLALLPDHVGSLLWRWLAFAALLGSTVYFHRRVIAPWCTFIRLPWLGLAMLPLVVSNLNNGQSNPFLLALILTALASVLAQRWNLAAACLAGAVYLKLYPIALALLLILLYPRELTVRFLVCFILGALLPYLMQNPSYVTEQYQTFFAYSFKDTRMTNILEEGNRDMWNILRRMHLPISLTMYRLIQLGSALLLAGLTLWLRPWRREPRTILLIGNLCLAWMLLMGPATESATYHLLAATLAADLLLAISAPNSGWSILVILSYALQLLAGIAGWFSFAHGIQSLGVQPFATLIWTTWLIHAAFDLVMRHHQVRACRRIALPMVAHSLHP